MTYLEDKLQSEMEFERLFVQTKGQPINYKGRELKMVDRIKVLSNEIELKVSFLKTDSNWRQGIIFQTKGKFEVNRQHFLNKIVLWEDTAPKKVQMAVNSKDKILVVYNAWKTDDGAIHYWHNGGAMYVELHPGYRIYNCNDGYPDDDLDDLI